MGFLDFLSSSNRTNQQLEDANTFINELLEELSQKDKQLTEVVIENTNLSDKLDLLTQINCEQASQISSLQKELIYSEKDNSVILQNAQTELDFFMNNKEIIIQELQQYIEILKTENEMKERTSNQLQALYQPFIESQKKHTELLSQSELLRKHTLSMNFFFLVNQYRMEKALLIKKMDFRRQYNAAVQDCRLKIEEYERELGIDEYKIMRPYISKSEFQNLSPCYRNQLALSRYNASPKTEFEVGLTYERYIGYLYELENYVVRYHGAVNKFKDKGIDLYALKKKEVLVIQCKRWNKDITINDGTIIKLSGSMNIARNKYPSRNIHGILYTTTQVSAEAKKEAVRLNIEIYEDFAIKEYPMIKCNISQSGEKIYHLPFDQMYDKTFITPSKGDFYAATVEEAENFGFRHAHKWKSEK